MDRDQISGKQLMTLLSLALLSPGVQLALGQASRRAGAVAWLAALGALPLLLLVGWLVSALTRGLPPGQGLADGLTAALGPRLGRLAAGLYLGWGLVSLALSLRQYGQKITMDYDDERLWFCLIALCVAAVWMASGKLAALARAGEIFYLAIAALLLVLLAAGALQIDPLNLIPVEGEAWAGLPAAAGEAAAVLGAGTYGGFLLGRVRREEGLPALGRRWTVKLCLVLAAVQLVILGGMGAWLAARSEMPLFLLARDMSIGSAIQRLEGVVVSLWVLSDLTLVALQLWTIAYLIRWLLGIRGRWLPPALGTAALACGAWWFSDPWTLKKFAAGILPLGNAAAAFLLPAAALAVGRIRRRGKRGGTSCASPPGKTEDIVVGKTGEKKMKKGPEKC